VTREAVRLVTSLYARLGERRAAGPDVLRDFLLQSVWCLFAEDLRQLEGHLFTQIGDDLLANPQRSSHDDLGQLFEWLNRRDAPPSSGMYAAARYVNGGLFEHPARVHLELDELTALRLACEYDWRKVEPHIFGSLLQDTLGQEAQHALGAHYTHEVDIQKVIKRRSSTRGAHGSTARQRCARSSSYRTNCSTSSSSTRPAARATSSTWRTARCDASSAGCTTRKRSSAERKVAAPQIRARCERSSR
jgi:hypothetical protein